MIIDTPLYVMKTICNDNLRIKVMVVELPSDAFMSYLDFTNQFEPAVINQVLNIIFIMIGDINSGVLFKPESLNTIKKDFDCLLISFIKHYRQTTQNIFVDFSDNENLQTYNDTIFTNKIIKSSYPEAKYDMKASIKNNIINFELFKKTNDVSKWPDLLKFYLI